MKRFFYLFLLSFVIAGCGGSKTEGPETPPVPEKITPEAATLVFPEQGAVCISGTGNAADQSTVVLKWNIAKNAVNYEVAIKNLINGTSVVQSTDKQELAVTISRSTPYSWSVTSKSKDGINSSSAVWKFYNSGAGVVSYPPFPADEMSPAFGVTITPQNGKIKLSWKGSDTDNDILNYDVYFGTSAIPALLKSANTAQSVDDVSVTAKTKYYWKIVTRDPSGNTADSDVLQFSTN